MVPNIDMAIVIVLIVLIVFIVLIVLIVRIVPIVPIVVIVMVTMTMVFFNLVLAILERVFKSRTGKMFDNEIGSVDRGLKQTKVTESKGSA
jgi:type IV secretory pathway VirB3-like protein